MNENDKKIENLEDKVRQLEVRLFDLEQDETKEIEAQKNQRRFNMWLRIGVYFIFLVILIGAMFFFKGWDISFW